MATIRFKMVLPDFFDEKKVVAAGIAAVNKTLGEIEQDFRSSVKDFNHKPTFTKKPAVRQGNKIRGSVGTDEENYRRLNDGTSGHRVPKTGKRKMVFQRGYRKKTRRGRIPSVGGGPEGEVWGSYGHWIRGIDPRKFDETIARKNDSVLKRNVEEALQSLA